MTAVLMLAGGLRLWASFDDFWLDEIWTWELVQQFISSWTDVLLILRHENNHFLNTWWIYALGADTDWRWYRLPAVIMGVGLIVLERRAAADFGATAQRIVTILTVPSYLLIHYSSEARGYAYLMFFALAAYLLLERSLPPGRTSTSPARKPDPRRYWFSVCGFNICSVVGCLGHPAFLLVNIGLGLWAVVRIARVRWLWQQKLIVLVRLFGAPVICLGILWLINLSALQNSSGPPGDPWIVACETLSLMAGGPAGGSAALLVGGSVCLAIIVELTLLAIERDDRWVGWFAMIAGPLLLIVVTGRREVYPRYYLAAVVFLYVALAHLGSRCFVRGNVGRFAVIVACVAVTIGNGIHLVRLYEYGRGRAFRVVTWMDSHTEGPDIIVGSDFDFRNGMVLHFYSSRLKTGKQLVYVPQKQWPVGGPEWVLTHSLDAVWNPNPEFTNGAGNRYQLSHVFPYAGLSGWHTAVYHNTNKQLKDAPH